jgi:glutathione S-transferase
MALTLRYFDIRGKAEAIRMLLEQSGLTFEEVRFTGAEWRNSIKKEYLEKKITKFGQVPVLSIGEDKHLVQTNSILRYVARTVDAYGTDIDSQYQIDMIMDGVEDWRGCYVELVYGNYDEQLNNYLKSIPSTLEKYESLLQDNQQNTDQRVYFVGDKWSVADICVFDMLEHLLRLDSNCLNQYTLLNKFHQLFSQEPRIRAYLDSGKRPEKVNNSGKG